MITWTPITEMPDEMRDGRKVLIWYKDGAEKVYWEYGCWVDDDRYCYDDCDISHYSEINSPRADAPAVRPGAAEWE